MSLGFLWRFPHQVGQSAWTKRGAHRAAPGSIASSPNHPTFAHCTNTWSSLIFHHLSGLRQMETDTCHSGLTVEMVVICYTFEYLFYDVE